MSSPVTPHPIVFCCQLTSLSSVAFVCFTVLWGLLHFCRPASELPWGDSEAILVRARLMMWEEAEVPYPYYEDRTSRISLDSTRSVDTKDVFIAIPDEPELPPMPRRFLVAEKGDEGWSYSSKQSLRDRYIE